MSPRSRRRVVVVIAAVVVVVLVVVGAAWYFLGEQRRLARVLTSLVVDRTGLPVTIDRASTDGSRLDLYGVRLQATPALPLDVMVSHLELGGGVLSLLSPGGRRLSVVATTASITVRAGGAPPDETAVEALRRLLASAFEWPGALSLRVDDGQLRLARHTYRGTLSGDKSASGLTLDVALADRTGAAALTLAARAAPPRGATQALTVELSAHPRRLAGLWPDAVPPPATLAARGDVGLVSGGHLTATGRATVGDAVPRPAVVDFTSRYDAAAGRLTVSRYALQWGGDVRLRGTGTVARAAGGVRVDASTQGAVDGRPLRGRVTYHLATHALEGELSVEGFSARRVAGRLGMPSPPVEITAQTVNAAFTGTAGGARPAVTIDMAAWAVTTPGASVPALDATLKTRLALVAGASRPSLRALEAAEVVLIRDGQPVGRLSAHSTTAALWPLSVAMVADDLERVAPLLPMASTLAGSATITGELGGTEPLAFRGRMEVQLPSAQLINPGPLTLTTVRASLPVVWGGSTDEAGSVTVARVSGWGFAATDVASTARLVDGRLLLPDVHYAQYGGHGQGWLEAALDGRELPFRLRLDGERIDLARAVREIGARVGQISGTVHYVASAQYMRGQGLAAVARIDSDEGGGEVSIDAIERLLESAAVHAESSGVLRQTLQALRVFRYESLAADLRLTGGAGHLDVALRGKKRLGIFPAPVEAINLKNVPLAVLSRALGKGSPQ